VNAAAVRVSDRKFLCVSRRLLDEAIAAPEYAIPIVGADGPASYTAEDLRVGLVEAHHEGAPTSSAL